MARMNLALAFVVGLFAMFLLDQIDLGHQSTTDTAQSNPSRQTLSPDKSSKQEIRASNEDLVVVETMVTIPDGGSFKSGSGLPRTRESRKARDNQFRKLVLLVKPRNIIPEE